MRPPLTARPAPAGVLLPMTTSPRARGGATAAAAGRRNDTTKGPRHETRPSAANARSRSSLRRRGEVAGRESDPLVPDELLREAQGTEAYRYARALAAAVSARRRPLALRAALALAVARPGRLLAPAAPAPGGGGGGVRPAALAARLVQLSETFGISVADAAELLAGAFRPEDGDGACDEQQQQQQEQQQQPGRRRRADAGARLPPPPPPPAALEDVLPLRLLRAAEALIAALELDLDEEGDDGDGGGGEGEEWEEEQQHGGGRGGGGSSAEAAAAASSRLPYSLPAEPPADARACALRLAVRAIAARPDLLDASPLDVRRGAAAAASALGLPPRLAARRLIAREPALLGVAPEALARRLSALARALASLSGGGSAVERQEQVEEEYALALALVLREPRLLLPPARALAANLAALPRALGLEQEPDASTSADRRPTSPPHHPLPLLLLHAPRLALVPAGELARRLEALRRLLPPPAEEEEQEGPPSAPPLSPAWPLLRTSCGLEYDPGLLVLPPGRLAERARHLQRLERLAAAAAGEEDEGGGRGGGGGGAGGSGAGSDARQGLRQRRRRQRRARLLAVSPAALDGWCADALHISPGGRAEGGGGAAAAASAAAAAAAARRLVELA